VGFRTFLLGNIISQIKKALKDSITVLPILRVVQHNNLKKPIGFYNLYMPPAFKDHKNILS
jgi:hypothetical protein